jgi:hypothetical protein
MVVPVRVLFGIILVMTTSSSRADEQAGGPFVPVIGDEIGAAVNLPSKNLKAEGTLFLPRQAITRVRAVIVVMKHGETEERMLTGLNPYSPWHKVSETVGAGLLSVRMSPIRAFPPGPTPVELEPQRNAATGADEALNELLRRLGVESGHPELREVPLLFWGWSAAAGFGPSFARLHPDRTLGFIRYHSHLRGLPVDLETAKTIPALLFAGAAEGPEIPEDSRNLFRSGRAVGAPWAFVLQPGVPHEIRLVDMMRTNPLVVSWITAVARERLPQSGTRLRTIPQEMGWLGDPNTGEVSAFSTYSAAKSEASWLPDEPTARAWQSAVTAPKP